MFTHGSDTSAAAFKFFQQYLLKRSIVLGGGVAVFLLGDVLFRAILRLGTLRYRILAAIAALQCCSSDIPTRFTPLERWSACLGVNPPDAYPARVFWT